MKRLGILNKAIIFLIPVIFNLFYCYVGFDINLTKMLMFITAFLLAIFVVTNTSLLNISDKNSYDRYLAILFLLILFSIFNSFVYWGQNPVSTFRAGAHVFIIPYYFVLKKHNINVKHVEKLIFLLAAIYTLLWLYAVSQAPRVVFGFQDDVEDSRGFYRIIQLPGIYDVVLSYFIFLQRAMYTKGKKLLWIFLSIASFTVVFLTLSRSLFLGISIITLYSFMRTKPVFLFLSIIAIWVGSERLISNSEILSSFSSITTDELSDSKFGSRTAEYTEFLDIYPFHIGTTLFGNGAPHIISEYGQYEEKMKASRNFHRSDSAIINAYVTYGLFFLLVIYYMGYKIYKRNADYRSEPFVCFYFFMLITSFAGNHLFDGISTLVMTLYILEQYRKLNYEENHNVCL